MATISKYYHLNPSRPDQTKHMPYMQRLLHTHFVFIPTILVYVLVFCFIPFLANQSIHMHRYMQWVHVFVLRELLRNNQ